MAENSAGEANNLNKNHTLQVSILENSGIRDSDNERISIWREEDINIDGIESAHRNIIRQEAKHHIDKLVKGKLENYTSDIDHIDKALDEIAKERELKRERFRTEFQPARKSRKKRSDGPDNRLDLLIDRLINSTAGLVNSGLQRLKLKPTKRLDRMFNFLVTKESILSDKMAKGVDRVDLWIDKQFEHSLLAVEYINKRQIAFKGWSENHKKQLLGAAAALTIVSGSVAMWIGHITAYEYMYNGKVMGIVKNQQDVYKTIDIIGDKLSLAYEAEIAIDKETDISFRKVVGANLTIDSSEDVLNQFTYLRDMNATAYAIKVGDEQKAVLYSKACAEEILSKIQGAFLSDNSSISYESIGFAEDVEIVEINTKIGNIQKEDKVLEYMLTGAVEIKTYTVKSGDTFGQIAKNLNLSMEDLQKTNSEVHPAKLQIGQELVLNRVCPVLTVQTTEIAEFKEVVDYEVEIEETSTLYKGEQSVKSKGVKGQRLVVAQIVRNNGEEVTRNELSSEIISQPKAQVVLKGTKDLPPLIGTGSFQYPARGTSLTSRFGSRWGRMHNGIDLAAPTGTKIRAADGGLVISAGWEGALGYCVRIDHGQNKVTVYGHCSKLFVKKGDRVYKDQHIANIGNTGRSTGPHVHFEVHVNGVPQNPLKYLK